ncbi:hypothetical protein N431DRAFT_478501 [Stipitochalara longipes BDJ]|nr:hypothetical protein N431DRAFT_478501 [Stipitochalara longipes BDJ]
MTTSSTITHPAELNSGIWTSWLPLTTAWPSQSACNSAIWIRGSIDESDDSFPYIFDPDYGSSVANSLTCLPPYATQWWEGAVTTSNTITSWSIGPIVCPAAYTTASTTVVSGSSTSVMCCPSNFEYVRNVPGNPGRDNGICTSPFTSGQSLTYASPATNSFTAATTTFTDNNVVLFGVPVEGYNFAASTTSSSVTGSPTTSTSKSTSPTNTSAPSSGLSSGAKAGIGVGVAIVALAILGAIGFWLLRRRKSQAGPVSELPGNGEGKSAGAAEVYSEPVLPSEIDGSPRPQELHG